MKTPAVVKRLQRLNFPECTQEALKYLNYLVTSLEKAEGAAPAIPAGPDTALGMVCLRFIHFVPARGSKVLSPLEELQLLQMVCDFLQAAQEKHKYRLFQLMFEGSAVQSCLLTKVVSLALSLSQKSVLDCTAIWMQEPDHAGEAFMLASRLVQDFCELYNDPLGTFRTVPKVSPLFACNLTTIVTTLYPFSWINDGGDLEELLTEGSKWLPPVELLDHVTWWLSRDFTLCCESLRQLPIHGNFSSPVPGLLSWNVLGPVVCMQLLSWDPSRNAGAAKAGPAAASFAFESNTVPNVNRGQVRSTMETLSRLHLAVLHSVEYYAACCSPLSECLLSTRDIKILLNQLSAIVRVVHMDKAGRQETVLEGKEGVGAAMQQALMEKELAEVGQVNVAMERLAQMLQVAHGAGCLMEHPGALVELANMAENLLPPNRLFKIVMDKLTNPAPSAAK